MFPNCSYSLQTPFWDHDMCLFAMHPCASETLRHACYSWRAFIPIPQSLLSLSAKSSYYTATV